MIQMAGHKSWSGIKTKMTPEMRLEVMAKAESLAQEILDQKIDKSGSPLSEKICRSAEFCSDNEVRAYVASR